MADFQQQFYPPVSFYFKLLVDDIDGLYEAGFENVSGLDVKIETENVEEGGVSQFSRKLPKSLQYTNLVLKRGLITGSPLIKWINKALEQFIFEPKRIQVSLLNEKGNPLVNWTFSNAYPVAVKISELNSKENKYFVESLEFAYDYFIRKDI
jgi:phage tail-like protein